MQNIEMMNTLWTWTPYLAGGFVYNLLISAVSMIGGTLIGMLIGWGRDSGFALFRGPSILATSLCRNVPSFVLMFYVAFVLPVEVEWAGSVTTVPMWIKATLALTIPVIGFASDQYLAFRRQRSSGLSRAGGTFLTAWLQYFLIIIMASATASVIGADEIVGRANRIIATDHRPEFMIATYVYVSAWFFVAGMLLTNAITLLVKARSRAK